jgi:hypothetical protein
MTDDDIATLMNETAGQHWGTEHHFRRFAYMLLAAEREKVAHWMRSMGYATGHGDTIEDLLDHLGTQIAEKMKAEREACADICDQHASIEGIAQKCAAEIRARGNT